MQEGSQSPTRKSRDRSPSYEHIETSGAANNRSRSSSPVQQAPHPVAAVIASSSNAVAYMAPNTSNVMSSDSSGDEVSFGSGDGGQVCAHHVAAVLPSRPSSMSVGLKAPLHIDHLFWRCAVRGGSTDNELVPVFDALIDHGAHTVLIRSSLVDELGLKRRKLGRPEDVETAMSKPGDPSCTTTLTEFVKLRLYCPVSGWGARTVRAIIAPSLCSPIILGLPFIGFNDVLVDVKLRTAICKYDGHDLLNPTPCVTKVLQGAPLRNARRDVRHARTQATRS